MQLHDLEHEVSRRADAALPAQHEFARITALRRLTSAHLALFATLRRHGSQFAFVNRALHSPIMRFDYAAYNSLGVHVAAYPRQYVLLVFIRLARLLRLGGRFRKQQRRLVLTFTAVAIVAGVLFLVAEPWAYSW